MLEPREPCFDVFRLLFLDSHFEPPDDNPETARSVRRSGEGAPAGPTRYRSERVFVDYRGGATVNVPRPGQPEASGQRRQLLDVAAGNNGR